MPAIGLGVPYFVRLYYSSRCDCETKLCCDKLGHRIRYRIEPGGFVGNNGEQHDPPPAHEFRNAVQVSR